MDDHVARVDEHPVALGSALDLGIAVAGILQVAQQVIGDGADMPVRTARGDDDREKPTVTALYYEPGTEPGLDVVGGHRWTAKIPEGVEKRVAASFGRKSPELLPIFDLNKKVEASEH